MIRTVFTLFLLSAVASFGQTSAPIPASKITHSSANVDGPYVALTFDDGPSAATTPRLLDILAKQRVKATFFVLGECVHANPTILKREAAEGHEIANHSWSHPNLAKMSDDAVRSQIQRTSELIESLTGTPVTLFRPPYGSLAERQRHFVRDLGYQIILWSIDPLDWKKPGASAIAQRIVNQTKSGDIILAHDIHAQTVDATTQIIEGLRAKGFKFVTVGELLAMDRPLAKPAPTTEPALSPEDQRKYEEQAR